MLDGEKQWLVASDWWLEKADGWHRRDVEDAEKVKKRKAKSEKLRGSRQAAEGEIRKDEGRKAFTTEDTEIRRRLESALAKRGLSKCDKLTARCKLGLLGYHKLERRRYSRY
jgi:hypothetical protein